MQIEKTDLFEKTPIPKAILSLVIPTIISQIIFVIYNMADTFFIGQLGDPNQVAAATLAMPPFVLLTGIANIFGIGGASLISRSLGNGDKEKAKRCAAFCVWSAATVALLYGIFMYFFRAAVFPILGADSNTYGFCLDYIFWTITIGAIPTVLNACLGHLIRSEGFSKQASIGMALGGIINMILDPVFIFGFHLDIAGAAIATMLSNSAATIYFLFFIIRRRKTSAISVSPKYYSLKEKIPSEVMAVGLPSFLMIVLGILSSWTANKLVVAYSNQAVAGMGIAKKLDMLTFALANGMTQGVLPLIAYNYSAKNHKRLHEAIKTAFLYSLVVAVTCTFLLLIFAVPVSQFFINDAETVAYAKHFLRIICTTCPAITITTMIITLFQATAQKVQPTVLSVLKRGVVDVFLMMLMNKIIGVNGIPWATFIADIFAMLVAICIFVPYWKKVKANIREGAEQEVIIKQEEGSIAKEKVINPVITIGRSYGAGGRSVGKIIAEQLGIPYYDSELLEQAAVRSGLSRKFLEGMDEKSISTAMLYGYSGFISDRYSYIEQAAGKAQREIIESVASEGSCVIIGRRADKILKDSPNIFRVFITASVEARTKRIMIREHLSERESVEKIRKVDRERADYYNQYSDGKWGVADNYDLCIDTDKIGVEEAASIIVNIVRNNS